MKKGLAVLLAMMLGLSIMLFGCSDDKKAPDSATDSASEPAPVSVPDPVSSLQPDSSAADSSVADSSGTDSTSSEASSSSAPQAASSSSPPAPKSSVTQPETTTPAPQPTGFTTERLNLRVGPGTDQGQILTIPALEPVTQLGTTASKPDWVYISYGDKKGWSSKQYINFTDVVAPETTTADPKPTGTTTDNLHLRKGPGTGYGVIQTMPAKSAVTQLGTTAAKPDWIYVSYGDKKGWAAKKYITMSSQATSQPTSQPASDIVAPETTIAAPQPSGRTTAALRLRKGPGTDYESILTMPDKSVVAKSGTTAAKPDWVYVTYGDKQGWAKAEYIKFE